MFLSIHYTELKGYTLDFCMTLYFTIHYIELKGFTLDFCMTLYLTIRPAASILDRHDNRAASSVRPQHISLVADHNYHIPCIVLQTTAQLST